jgi:hypothetical protein
MKTLAQFPPLKAVVLLLKRLWSRFFPKASTRPSIQDLSQLAGELDAWMKLEHALRQDVTELFDLLDRDPDAQVVRRAVVRGAWGFKEGCLNGLSAFVSKAEELSNDIDDRRPPSNERTLERIKAILKWCGRRLAPGWQPDFSNSGWQTLRRSLRVRDRLMHPKTALDLQISDEEIEQTQAALAWFLATITDLQTRALAHSHTVTSR